MKEFHLVTKLSGASIDAQSACLNSLIPIRDVSVLNKGQVVNTFWRIGNQSFQSKNLNFQPEKAGNLTLFLRVQNEQSCYDSVEKTIQIYEIPKVSLEPDFGVCAGNSKTILADVQGANTLLWTPAQSLSCSTCINPKVTPFDTKKYTLTAKNAQNCIHSDSIIVQYIPILKPQVAINPGDARCYTEPIQFSPKISGYDPFCLGPLRYKWNFGDGNIDTNAVPIHRFKSPGLYDVELQIPGRGIAKTQVKLLPEDSCFTNIWVPNAFSPNNDQQNDVLYVRGINVRSLQFRLYNRWGELVFETNQLSKGWDGRYKEEICSPQSFVYTLEATFIDNRSISSKGNISIVP